jgi:hypothetical protein
MPFSHAFHTILAKHFRFLLISSDPAIEHVVVEHRVAASFHSALQG